MKNSNSILREPILHFFAVGVILFVVYSLFNGGESELEAEPTANPVRINGKRLDHLEVTWEQLWKRKPTDQELARLVNDYVREELLYREALALGLDEDDAIVRRRMAQKMAFLSKGATANMTEESLQSWFNERKDSYTLLPTVSFHHLIFSRQKRGDNVNKDAKATIAKLGTTPPDMIDEATGDRSMIRNSWTQMTEQELAPLFGKEMAKTVFALKPGVWQGPVESQLGVHIVYVSETTEESLPTLDQVRNRVEMDWMQEQVRAANQKVMSELVGKYGIEITPDAKSRLKDHNLIGEEIQE